MIIKISSHNLTPVTSGPRIKYMADINAERIFTVTLDENEWRGVVDSLVMYLEDKFGTVDRSVWYAEKAIETKLAMTKSEADGVRALVRFDQSIDWQGA